MFTTEYEQFVAQFTDKLQQNMEPGVELTRSTCKKVNEGEVDSLVVKWPDSPVAPTIYFRDKFPQYEEGISVDDIAHVTAAQLLMAKKQAPVLPEISIESARQNLYLVLINQQNNKELLKNVPHEKVNDLAAVARFRVSDDASFLVTNDLCKNLKITSEEVLDMAYANLKPENFECQNMNEVMKTIFKEQGMPDDYMEDVFSRECPIYVASNKSRVDGATAMLSKDFMSKSYERIQQDFPEMMDLYVIGSSRHELLLIPDCSVDSIDSLREMHCEGQSTELSEADKLSESIYRYDSRTRQITIAEDETRYEYEALEQEQVKQHKRIH